MQDPSSPEPEAAEQHPSTWVSQHPYVIGLGIAFMIAGAVGSPYLFPDLHPARAVLGGITFGAFCTLCAAAPRFF